MNQLNSQLQAAQQSLLGVIGAGGAGALGQSGMARMLSAQMERQTPPPLSPLPTMAVPSILGNWHNDNPGALTYPFGVLTELCGPWEGEVVAKPAVMPLDGMPRAVYIVGIDPRLHVFLLRLVYNAVIFGSLPGVPEAMLLMSDEQLTKVLTDKPFKSYVPSMPKDVGQVLSHLLTSKAQYAQQFVGNLRAACSPLMVAAEQHAGYHYSFEDCRQVFDPLAPQEQYGYIESLDLANMVAVPERLILGGAIYPSTDLNALLRNEEDARTMRNAEPSKYMDEFRRYAYDYLNAKPKG